MISLLQSATFRHDLDTYKATGTARSTDGATITFAALLDESANPSAGINDLNSLTITYQGSGSLNSLHL